MTNLLILRDASANSQVYVSFALARKAMFHIARYDERHQHQVCGILL